MADVTLKLSLPEALERYVSERVVEGGYASAGDYIRALIHEDQRRGARDTLDRMLLEGLDSDADPITPEYLAELRREAKQRIDARRKRA